MRRSSGQYSKRKSLELDIASILFFTPPPPHPLPGNKKKFLNFAEMRAFLQVIECVLFLNFEAPRRLAGTPALRLSLIELALNQITRIEKRFIRRSRCRNG
jgi:hypothetical protein